MIRDTVEFLRSEGRRVFLDAEHFFDGYLLDPDYALSVVETAYGAGADVVALCDTNGGMLPGRLAEIVHQLAQREVRVGIHAHNDTACAVANSLAAVDAGATHVLGGPVEAQRQGRVRGAGGLRGKGHWRASSSARWAHSAKVSSAAASRSARKRVTTRST